jgi:predicted transcriptional regulator
MNEKKPTESEMEILQIMWRLGSCTVRDVHEELIKNKEVGYTTTLKLMQIMHEKSLVDRDTSSKSHIYNATLNQDKVEKQLVGKMIDDVFSGSASRLIMQALGNHRASEKEIEEIKKYLNDLDLK